MESPNIREKRRNKILERSKKDNFHYDDSPKSELDKSIEEIDEKNSISAYEKYKLLKDSESFQIYFGIITSVYSLFFGIFTGYKMVFQKENNFLGLAYFLSFEIIVYTFIYYKKRNLSLKFEKGKTSMFNTKIDGILNIIMYLREFWNIFISCFDDICIYIFSIFVSISIYQYIIQK